ncbi:MAG: isoprenoid biosynthesis glyoxalase ElbB [Proteobacteria bacterium]|nr:isoprenoid biosynthesis glyoxalase ElbB [Pseudomonadota bacterium]
MGKKRIGVILCGCGHRDGSEVHEATLTLLAIDLAGAEALCFAPAGEARFVRDHLSGDELPERRSMIVESARIARGRIDPLAEARAADLDALIIPGGQGAALNLSSYLADGARCSVEPETARLIREMAAAGKPVGAICIAPATLARALEEAGISAVLTAGDDEDVARDVEAMGHRHERSLPTECVIDRKNRVVTTPAYMNARSIGEVWKGVGKLVDAVIEMA